LKTSHGRILTLLVLIGVLSATLAYQIWMRRTTLPLPPSPGPGLSLPSLEPKRSVRLFFASADEGSLQEEMREIKAGAVHEEAKMALLELIKGPGPELVSPLPPGIQLRQLYIDGQGIAYVDFGPELRDLHPGGSRAELLAVYSIVDTLAYNFDQVKRVKILIEGSEIETLAGHIDLRRPLKPRVDFDERS